MKLHRGIVAFLKTVVWDARVYMMDMVEADIPGKPLENAGEVQIKTKQPYAFALAGGGIMARAGLWETWKSPAEELVRSFTIVTTTPNELCAEVHDRMPVILPPSVWSTWLGEETVDSTATLKRLLVPYPADDMVMWPVSQRVGNVRNNNPSLIERIDIAA